MFIILRTTFLICLLFILNFTTPTSTLDKDNENSKKLSDSTEDVPVPNEKEIETELGQLFDQVQNKPSENEEEEVEISTDEIEKIKEEEYQLANELNKKAGKPEISHEAFNKVWNEKKKEYGKHFNSIAVKMLTALKESAEKIDSEELSESELRHLFNKVEEKPAENGEQREVPFDELEEIKEKEYQLANDLNKKTGKPEISHEVFDKVWDEKKEEYGKHFNSIAGRMLNALKEAAEKVDSEESPKSELRHLFDKTKDETSENEEEEMEISSDEMEKIKEEEYELVNKLNKKAGKHEVPHEVFDEVWDEKKKEYGKHFNTIAGKMLVALKEAAEAITETSEAVSVTPTQTSDVMKEEPPEDTYAFRNAKGKICILAKFQSSIIITYPGKSTEEKIEVTIPHPIHTHIKGKCKSNNGSSLLQILWGKFIFSLFFNKTNEEAWSVTLMELTYDTSGGLFDEPAKRENITAKSKKMNLFETPYGKSYFCPAQEVILLYREDKHVATVRLKDTYLQPFDVKDGKFAAIHRCNQVIIGGPDEEPFVQDETVPLAVGCTLALITLLILVGFSVHRAYNAAKVDYNTVE